MKKRALLLSGGLDRTRNHPRYVRNIAAAYRCLVRVHGYDSEDVRICFAEGVPQDLLGDGSLHPVRSATQGDVDAALEWLAELGADDQALLLVTDHGGKHGICLWGPGVILTPGDLAAALANSPATKILVFAQCNAGIFAPLATSLARTVVICASDSEQSVWALRDLRYTEFLYHLIGALAGEYPDGSALRSPVRPKASLPEALRYVEAYTSRPRADETPSLYDPNGIAAQLQL